MKPTLLSGACALILCATPALANEFEAKLTDLAKTKIAAIATAPEIVDAIKAQNAETAGYDQAKVDELDKEWRAEVGAADQPMIKQTLERPASAYLAKMRDQSGGLFTEIFAMDDKGLNVAQSDATSDYWQGDEAKWQNTFLKGPSALDVSDVEQDESTQVYQSQVSVPVVDPADDAVVGALTVGVNVELLP